MQNETKCIYFLFRDGTAQIQEVAGLKASYFSVTL